MDTFRKWLNKPKADDKSLLARFYHADRALTTVASELDSFDGRAEPDRCSRLVSRLRQGQDKVLLITNLIMEELLGEERAPRVFRAKFPEEVLQENLAGQLWFGAECLAAGSSIMNREIESSAMRPLAKAVTKSLDNVRNLLRDQCLRNNIPNSQTLRLDINDAATEQLYESLKIFDRLFAEFELRYVSAMVQVKSKHEYEMQELISVLFSETLQRSLRIGLIEQDQVDTFDPALMFSIPRLAIIAGLVVYTKGPLNMGMPADQLSEMFRPFRTILINIRDLLRTLNKNELFQLEKLLCTNEDNYLKSNNNKTNCDEVRDDKSISDQDLVSSNLVDSNNSTNRDVVGTPHFAVADSMSSSTDTSVEWTDDEIREIKENLATADCASGFLIPNTNFGNLLQTNEAPLTDNFIASDDEFDDTNERNENRDNNNVHIDSGICTEYTGSDRTADSDNLKEVNKNNSPCPTTAHSTPKCGDADSWNGNDSLYMKRGEANTASCSKMEMTDSSEESEQQTITSSQLVENSLPESTTTPTTTHSHHYHHHHHSKSDKSSTRRSHHRQHRHHSKKRSKKHSLDTSSGDTSSSLSDGDPSEVKLELRAAGRMKFKSTDVLLHRLFVCIAGVADQLQTNFAPDLRQILRSVFLINTTPAQEEIEIPAKTKDSDLFEFRASENDVIQENAGSNQSIYSAEEVNAELDNVFAERSSPQRGHSLENEMRTTNRSNISRSRSLGEDSSERLSITGNVRPSSLNERCSSQESQSGSNSPINSSASNSPVGGRTSRSLGSSTPNFCSETTTVNTAVNNIQSSPSPSPPPLSRQSKPPAWIPDDEAPRCMACTIPFTAFRRRHHCRNCGGVFCGGCSNSSAPLPKYGLVKAVRVCRDCFVREVGT